MIAVPSAISTLVGWNCGARNLRWGVSDRHSFDCAAVLVHVSASPPLIPDGRVSRIRLAAMACPKRTFPGTAKFRHSLAHTPCIHGYTSRSTPSEVVTAIWLSVQTVFPVRCPPSTESPFARRRCYLLRNGFQHRFSRRYPTFIAHTGSCARPNASRRTQLSLLRRVLAGCHEPLLAVGPSRRYSVNLSLGARTPTPVGDCGALARFFPQSHRPSPRYDRVGFPTISRTATPVRGSISGLQPFDNLRALRFARHPGRSYHVTITQQR